MSRECNFSYTTFKFFYRVVNFCGSCCYFVSRECKLFIYLKKNLQVLAALVFVCMSLFSFDIVSGKNFVWLTTISRELFGVVDSDTLPFWIFIFGLGCIDGQRDR